jgi:hypothetical protein
MREDRGQNAEIVDRVAIDVLVAIAKNVAAAGRLKRSIVPVTTECATRRVEFASAPRPKLFNLATTLRTKTEAGAAPDTESASTPVPVLLLEVSLSATTTLSDAPVVNLPSTVIPVLLLSGMTLLRTPMTTADPLGSIPIPPALLEAIVFDTEKLLDVLGEIKIPV